MLRRTTSILFVVYNLFFSVSFSILLFPISFINFFHPNFLYTFATVAHLEIFSVSI